MPQWFHAGCARLVQYAAATIPGVLKLLPCCLFSSFKTLVTSTEGIALASDSTSRVEPPHRHGGSMRGLLLRMLSDRDCIPSGGWGHRNPRRRSVRQDLLPSMAMGTLPPASDQDSGQLDEIASSSRTGAGRKRPSSVWNARTPGRRKNV